MAQQTAVDWFFTQILGSLHSTMSKADFDKVLEQAKKMEKEQVISAQMDMFHFINNLPFGIEYLNKRDECEKFTEQYYNETYNK